VLKEADFDEPQEDEENKGSEPTSSGPKNTNPSPVSTAEILRSIKDGSKAPSQDAVNKDLEALRLQTLSGDAGKPVALSQSSYRKLRTKISESYSVKQLSGYVQYLEKRTNKDQATPEVLRAVVMKGPGITRSQWVPGSKPEVLSKKPTLVDNLLRTRWRIDTAGERGRLVLSLQSWQFWLLNAGGLSFTLSPAD
jgi:hypothetical protein